jgi:rare lipoprotein A
MAALLGLSIALTLGHSVSASTVNISSRSEVTSDARVGTTSNALTQESRRQISARRVVRQTKYRAVVSWYRHGSVTANGERYNPMALTVAHRTLPFNTWVRFTNPETGVDVVARVNDRGPFVRGREFDLSMGTARSLGIIDRGIANVIIEIVQEGR